MGMTEVAYSELEQRPKVTPSNNILQPISSDKIIEQIVYLDRKDDVGKIGTLRCFDRRLTQFLVVRIQR